MSPHVFAYYNYCVCCLAVFLCADVLSLLPPPESSMPACPNAAPLIVASRLPESLFICISLHHVYGRLNYLFDGCIYICHHFRYMCFR